MKDSKNTPAIPSGQSAVTQSAVNILSGRDKKKGRVARLMPFLGPAFIASVAYMDPGNFAANIQGGAKFGYRLLWVVISCNLIAVLIQILSAKLGIASGCNLAEQCRKQYSRPAAYFLWILMELVAMATDLAEFLGAALGFHLLFGMPLGIAGILTALITFLILGLERYGFRPLEATITAFIAVVALCYLIEIFLISPDWGQVLHHAIVPSFQGPESVLIAAGILGATVMPHAIFLHSALTQNRIVVHEPAQLRLLFRYEIADVAIAMGAAGLINAAMLIMAAATFHRQGLTSVGTIEEAYRTLEPLLGRAAGWVFGISLLASGLSSSSVGTMAGQVIMQGFIQKQIAPWVRRLVTIAPSLVVIWMGWQPTRVLILSQVMLSFGLPFAIIPLVIFTSRKEIMGVLVNRKVTTLAAGLAAALVVLLNLYLLYQTFWGD